MTERLTRLEGLISELHPNYTQTRLAQLEGFVRSLKVQPEEGDRPQYTATSTNEARSDNHGGLHSEVELPIQAGGTSARGGYLGVTAIQSVEVPDQGTASNGYQGSSQWLPSASPSSNDDIRLRIFNRGFSHAALDGFKTALPSKSECDKLAADYYKHYVSA